MEKLEKMEKMEKSEIVMAFYNLHMDNSKIQDETQHHRVCMFIS